MATWTQREWRLVAAALPKDVDRPTPRQLDTAQRAALPKDRWRTRSSMYGLDAAIAIKLNIAAARAQTPDYAKVASEAHEQRQRDERENLARRLHIDRMYRPKFAPLLGDTPSPGPAVTQGNSSCDVPALAHRRRVYVVGLVGMQAQRVRAELDRVWGDLPGLDLVFVESDSIRKLVGLSGAYIVCTRFIDRSVHDVLVQRAKRCVFSHTANPATMAGYVADLYGEAVLDSEETELKMRRDHRGTGRA